MFFGSYLHLGRVRTASIAHSRIIYSSLLYTLSCIVLSPSLSQLETLLLQNNSLSLLGMKRQRVMFMCSLTYLSSDSSSHVVPPRRQFEAFRCPRHQGQEDDCGHHQQCRGRTALTHPSLHQDSGEAQKPNGHHYYVRHLDSSIHSLSCLIFNFRLIVTFLRLSFSFSFFIESYMY